MNRIIHFNHSATNNQSKPVESADHKYLGFMHHESRDDEMTYSISFQDARVYMPVKYEPNYAYPLIVYL
ncbi:MAG TPA: hypothetical protein DIW81_25355, partial [Planctomycetaceae bacterium]|nr:hypothetical protein [Planctomycetaceae bacterium]